MAWSHASCPPPYIECNDVDCIAGCLYCSDIIPCPDEQNCLNCSVTEFICDNRCIPLSHLCDSFKDCTDGSDEECYQVCPEEDPCYETPCATVPAGYGCNDYLRYFYDDNDGAVCPTPDPFKFYIRLTVGLSLVSLTGIIVSIVFTIVMCTYYFRVRKKPNSRARVVINCEEGETTQALPIMQETSFTAHDHQPVAATSPAPEPDNSPRSYDTTCQEAP